MKFSVYTGIDIVFFFLYEILVAMSPLMLTDQILVV